MLLVDRLLTESTLEAAIFESRNLSKRSMDLGIDDIKIDMSLSERDSRDCSSPRKIVECRICQDEDENANMDTPCSCCGSLKVSCISIPAYLVSHLTFLDCIFSDSFDVSFCPLEYFVMTCTIVELYVRPMNLRWL